MKLWGIVKNLPSGMVDDSAVCDLKKEKMDRVGGFRVLRGGRYDK